MEVQIVLIVEISMVSGKLLYQIHKRLNEIFSPQQGIHFGGKLGFFVETCISCLQFKQNQYLCLMRQRLLKSF